MTFQERLWPSTGFFLATLLIIPAMTVLFMPFSFGNGIYVGIGLYILIAVIFMLGAPKVTVTQTHLHAGRGKIERKFLGEAIALDRIAYRQAIGRKLDARAFLAMNGWVKTGVKVTVTDPADNTPYWIISTRKPQQLVESLKN